MPEVYLTNNGALRALLGQGPTYIQPKKNPNYFGSWGFKITSIRKRVESVSRDS